MWIYAYFFDYLYFFFLVWHFVIIFGKWMNIILNTLFYNNVIDKSQAFFKTIFTRNIDYQMKIKLDKIMCIQVTYEAVPMLFLWH